MMASYKKNTKKGQDRGVYGAWKLWEEEREHPGLREALEHPGGAFENETGDSEDAVRIAPPLSQWSRLHLYGKNWRISERF